MRLAVYLQARKRQIGPKVWAQLDVVVESTLPAAIARVTIKPRPMVQGAGETIEERRGEFLLSTDRARLDLNAIHGFLTACYWAKGIPREVVARSIQNSLCFGMYKQAQQVGFARVISDFATYAYI